MVKHNVDDIKNSCFYHGSKESYKSRQQYQGSKELYKSRQQNHRPQVPDSDFSYDTSKVLTFRI